MCCIVCLGVLITVSLSYSSFSLLSFLVGILLVRHFIRYVCDIAMRSKDVGSMEQ